MRLDLPDRIDRFNGVLNDAAVSAYADRCFGEGATVVAYVSRDQIVGAAEIHERPGLIPPTGEIAFSVERGWQNRGIGGQLFERLIIHACALGYTRLLVTTHPQNLAMRALARKFGANLYFTRGETTGTLILPAYLVSQFLSPQPPLPASGV